MQQNEKRDEMRRRTAKFSANIVRFCTRLASRPECWKLASQLLDAGTSVASNYHAALRARSRAEFIAKLGVANEESDESVLWLVTIRDGGLEASEELQRLLQEATELRAIISRSRGTAIRNEKNRAELGRHLQSTTIVADLAHRSIPKIRRSPGHQIARSPKSKISNSRNLHVRKSPSLQISRSPHRGVSSRALARP